MKIQSHSDIITNSSSELFVFNNNETIDSVIRQISDIYPEWRDEYNMPDTVMNTDNDDLSVYIDYTNLGYMLPAYEAKRYRLKHNLPADVRIGIDDFDKNDCFARDFAMELGGTPESIYINWDNYNPFRQYTDPVYDTWLELTDEGYQLFKKKYGNEILLWSKGTNPSYESIQKFEEISHWVHLG